MQARSLLVFVVAGGTAVAACVKPHLYRNRAPQVGEGLPMPREPA